MWNWAKSWVPLLRVRRSWMPRPSGWRAATSTKRRRFSSGHSRSISWSTAWLEARQAPHSSQSAMAMPNSGIGAGEAEILVEHQRRDHREVEQQVALIMDAVGADRDRAGAADHRALIGDQRQRDGDRDDARRRCHIRHWRCARPAISRSTARQPMPSAEIEMMHDLDQRGERLRLAVAEAVVVVGRASRRRARRTG